VSEPVLKASTPDGRWVVEVVKDTAEELGGTYTGTLTLDGSTVVEAVKTEDTSRLLRWARRQMTEAMKRSGPEKTQV
jgi:hypothetical protein